MKIKFVFEKENKLWKKKYQLHTKLQKQTLEVISSLTQALEE